MIAFHGDWAAYHKVVSLAREHRDADQLIQGIWFPDENREHPRDSALKLGPEVKGCSVGCMLTDLVGVDKATDQMIHHSEDYCRQMARLCNVPRWMIMALEQIFEGLAAEAASEFHVDFYETLQPGVDYGPEMDIRHLDFSPSGRNTWEDSAELLLSWIRKQNEAALLP